MSDIEPQDRRRATRQLEQIEGGSFANLVRVILQSDLEPTGLVNGVVTIPIDPADPMTAAQADFWRSSGRVLKNIRNGLPTTDTIPEGAAAWVTQYCGKWCVVIPECS
jgi:hypothetical protein